jgi:hypothetical protein
MVSFDLEASEAEKPQVPTRSYRVVTQSLIVGTRVYSRGDIISSGDADMELQLFTGLRLIEPIEQVAPKKKKSFFQRFFLR